MRPPWRVAATLPCQIRSRFLGRKPAAASNRVDGAGKPRLRRLVGDMPQVRDLRRNSAPPTRFPVCRLRRAAPTVRVRSWFPAPSAEQIDKVFNPQGDPFEAYSLHSRRDLSARAGDEACRASRTRGSPPRQGSGPVARTTPGLVLETNRWRRIDVRRIDSPGTAVAYRIDKSFSSRSRRGQGPRPRVVFPDLRGGSRSGCAPVGTRVNRKPTKFKSSSARESWVFAGLICRRRRDPRYVETYPNARRASASSSASTTKSSA